MCRIVFILSCLPLLAGCVSDEQFLQVYENYKLEQRRTRENIKLIAELKTEIERLRQKQRALEMEIAKRDEYISTYRNLDWTKLLKGAEITSEGNLVLKGDVLFLPGSHTLTPQGLASLEQVAEVLRKEKDRIRFIRVEGHTDKTPIKKTKNKYDSNMELSFQRAYSVYRTLVEKSGIDADKFAIVAFGEHRPRSDNPADNRRVEIRILPKQ